MPRLNMEMSLMDMIIDVAEGNPGAAVAMVECAKIATVVDPTSFMGPFTAVLPLDELDIYGPRVGMLYKDVCNYDASDMIAVLRAVQLGYLTPEELSSMIDGRYLRENIDDRQHVHALRAKVEERLPEFQKKVV